MRTFADTAVGSAAGLVVLAAMFLTIWIARDSSARASHALPATDATPAELWSVRTHRSPVARTTITPEQVHQLRGR
jgi:hypothetical protein